MHITNKKIKEMKKNLLLLGILCFGIVGLSAQEMTKNEEFKIEQTLFGVNKKLILESFISFDEGEEEGFWNLFNEYESKRIAIAQKHFELVKSYIHEYDALDDELTMQIFKESRAVDKAYNKLLNSYFKKIKKSAGVREAVQFYQLERYARNKIRSELFEEIPFLGEYKEVK